MATAAQPRPAAAAASAVAGAAVQLHPLLVARMLAPPAMLRRAEGRLAALKALGIRVPRERSRSVVAFLVEHLGAGPLLIDTGFHSAVAVDPRQAFGRLGGVIFKDVRMSADQALSRSCASVGSRRATCRRW